MLLSMQQKLDDLCEQLNSSKNESVENARKSSPVDDQFAADGMVKQKGAEFCNCDHPFPELNPESGIIPLSKNLSNWTRVGVQRCLDREYNLWCCNECFV